MTLAGESFIVTGATGAVGRALVDLLAEAGAQVGVVVRSPERLEVLSHSPAAVAIADAEESEAFERAIARVADDLGAVSGIANLVGGLSLEPPSRMTIAAFDALLRINVLSAFAAIRVGERCLGTRGGSIVLVGSAAARVGLAAHEAVAAAKAGVEGLARAAAASLARSRIRVNVVAPGLVDAAMTRAIVSRPESLEASLELHALGRIGTGGDIARAVAFLLDPANDWITGAVLAVDGGLSSVRPRPKRRLTSQTSGQG